ncbi:exocyst complex component 6B [Exaiptasia diaphana]|uniref:Exocyst complex component n=1 Tax=Exaiptasia diaphana TaxID=2652724 RepID=A0A913YNL6_EXADI|nr:exocyst complex component 6B [Exaiptasia diaphana]XP_028516092.1 exocyst complex component 6B [Exaiptasia diaphana]KXJ11782.1 Exocyst complex component 6B [Exaiptasia diaphana]
MATDSSVGSSHIEHLLAEVESSDGLLGPTLRAVYDGEYQKEFMEKLEDRIKVHDKDIERMCNYHYQGFIESVNELLKVRGEARKLKIKVQEGNEVLKKSGTELVDRCEELIKCRTIQRNIASAIEALSVCLPVLDMHAKLSDQMSNRRYYPALKTLEQLEHTYLPRIKKFRFAEIMKNSIPIFRENIKEASMSDLRDFLESIRKESEKLGSVAMKQAFHRSNLTLSHGVGTRKKGDDDELDQSALDLVDFSPVYRCYHIYTVVGEKENFEVYYRKQRRKQARLVLQPNHGTIDESLEAYRAYFHQIVGFFVVEDTILHTAKGLVTRSTVDDLWDMAASKIAAVMRTQSAYCKETDLLIQVKELIVWFCYTLSGYGLNVNQIYDVLIEMRNLYNETLMKKWEGDFKQILEVDNYSPMYIEECTKYQDVLNEFPYTDKPTKNVSLPKVLPFSECPVKLYKEFKKFINACLKFNEHLNVSQTEIGDSVRKSTNLLLTRTLNGCFTSVVKRKEVSIPQLAQLSINTVHLEAACLHLEEYVSEVTGTANDGVNVTRVYGLSTFKDIRAEIEQQMYERLNEKIEDFIQLANYNWVPSGPRKQPSSYIMDLLAYLNSTFLNFSALPGNIAQTACLSSCKHLASSMRTLLLDEEVRQMNEFGIQCFNQDLRKCEEFANSNPVEGISDGTLQMTFLELRQLVDLLLSCDWSTFFKDHGLTESKYNRVNPQTAARLLEKLMESEKKKGFSLRKSDREKKKLNETIVKKLRSLNGETGNSIVQ